MSAFELRSVTVESMFILYITVHMVTPPKMSTKIKPTTFPIILQFYASFTVAYYKKNALGEFKRLMKATVTLTKA